jgi:hypothetical protein
LDYWAKKVSPPTKMANPHILLQELRAQHQALDLVGTASETTKKEPEFEPSEKTQDEFNVDAVFAKLKTIGGKKPDDEEE